VEPDVRDAVVDFVRKWSEKAETAAFRLVGWLQIGRSKCLASVGIGQSLVSG